ncbi:class I SAM-dependent methyltransferase [Methylobacillus flagellatus]|uniref:class I SAM-dependent methyltransferase n=1 Tax=Methylobacillus flagellatus TaxID=405 RepID=UPI0010F85870|nr:methyltransferase domain-containing protein [Methylobacillus flagellatus]
MSTQTQAKQWLATPLGTHLKQRELALFDEAVADVFGFNAVQIGMLELDLLRNARMPFRVRADVHAGEVRLLESQLPFLNNSVDLLLLPHALDFSAEPQQTLRECERILVPEGHLVLTGFNPLSLWGARRLLARRQGYPWQGNFFSLLRIKDWLALLGLELVSVRMAQHAPPLASPLWRQRFAWMDSAGPRCWPMMGGIYCIVAKKRVLGMRVIRPQWQKSKLKAGLVATPSPRLDHQRNSEPDE